jgi:tetratricopeptide (TPR) repeat protein
MRNARPVVFVLILLFICGALFAYEPSPEYERFARVIDLSIRRWQDAVRTNNMPTFVAQYWEDATRVVIGADGGKWVAEGHPAIEESQREIVRSLTSYGLEELVHLELPEPGLEGMPERPLPVYVFMRPDYVEVLQYEIRGPRVRIVRQLTVIFASGFYQAGEFASLLVDGDGNGRIDSGEQVLLSEWFMNVSSGPHRRRTPLDNYFDWDGNGRIDEAESIRAGRILYRDQLRFGAATVEQNHRFGTEAIARFVDEYVTLDEDPFVSLFEAEQAYMVARGDIGELPRPVDDLTVRIDLDMDGWIGWYEREIFARLLTLAVVRVPAVPMMSQTTPGTADALFHYADVNQNGRLSESELYDVGLLARQILTETEIVTNPLEIRYDRNQDFILSRQEREAALDELVSVLLPSALQYADLGLDRWVRLNALDQNRNGRIDTSEINLIQVGAINPRALFFKRPESPIEEMMDNDPNDGELQPHEVYSFIDGVFATIIQIYIEGGTAVAGGILDEDGGRFVAQESYAMTQLEVDTRQEPPAETTVRQSTSRSEPVTSESDQGEQSSVTDTTTPAQTATEPASTTSEVDVSELQDGLSLTVNLDPVFPVLFEYHAEEPIGTVSLTNTGTTTLRSVRAQLLTRQYMDFPMTGDTVPSVAPGEQVDLNLRALFNSDILDLTEGTRLVAQITVTYQSELGSGEQVLGEALQLYDRNAISWDDDRKVAAYVTPRSQSFMALSGNVARSIEEERLISISQNYQEAMAIFDALVERGITYRVDPSSAYATLSEDSTAVDYVRYPYQTWETLQGDCDDLSVLYVTMLEAAGIPSAFITVPGHIFVAFQLELEPDDARTQFSDPTDLIFDDEDYVWVPVEITLLDDGFVGAWQSGAETWRQYDESGDADLVVTTEAWEVYDPVQSPFDETLTQVDITDVVTSFGSDRDRFVSLEITDRETQWKQQLADTSLSDSARMRLQNRLGWLYANYGMMEEAKDEFETVLESNQYAPTLVNLGNIYYLDEEYEDAATYYDRALALDSDYVPALLGSARAYYALGEYASSSVHFQTIERVSPSLAADYGYLRVSSSARAAEAQSLASRVEWAVETDD